MRKLFFIVVLCFAVAGCTRKGGETPKKADAPAQGADVKLNGFVGVIQGATLDQLKAQTIGQAVANYRFFQKRDWNEAQADGRWTVDFYGQLDDALLSGEDKAQGVLHRTLNIKFVIDGNGAFWIDSISRYDDRGNARVQGYQVADFGSVLPRIWDNKELSF